ncbi:DUF1697 domain-containing protein [Caenimonas aquaedulcis]|uniref:DUF1697 domain-containing protein n=1 Tax=Caenimonas aquaedulcis TaxID=2793270 RepID=A0A931MIF3_9BURK|nr:DUF1697 domain-containing protein [Caenimonas aquaedulcis]
MPRYVAFLRGVSPLNAKMPELKACFEGAGFTNVKTVLASGNVVFNSRAATDAALEKKIEKAMEKDLGKVFYTIVRSVDDLQKILDADPFAAFKLPAVAKRVVTFVREPHGAKPKLPVTLEQARILAMDRREIFTAYEPQPGNPVFMTLIEKTFGKNVTTRTWDTVRKCVQA